MNTFLCPEFDGSEGMVWSGEGWISWHQCQLLWLTERQSVVYQLQLVLPEKDRKRGVTLTTLERGRALCLHKSEASLKAAAFPQKGNRVLYPSLLRFQCMALFWCECVQIVHWGTNPDCRSETQCTLKGTDWSIYWVWYFWKLSGKKHNTISQSRSNLKWGLLTNSPNLKPVQFTIKQKLQILTLKPEWQNSWHFDLLINNFKIVVEENVL